MLVDLAGTVYGLKKTLMQNVGLFEKDFMYKAGVAGARESIASMFERTLPTDPKTALETMLDIYTRRGYGAFAIRGFDAKKMVIDIETVDSAEASGFVQNKDLQKQPVCSYTRGVLSYLCSTALLHDLYGEPRLVAHEVECAGQGSTRCRFVIGPSGELVKDFPDLESRLENHEDSISEYALKLNGR